LKNLILHHFPGGIHPRDEKNLTAHLPIKDAPIPSRVFIPISQHIGAPAEPLVKPGDNVTVGDKIAEARGFVSANIHASVTGIVRSIKPYPNATGRKATAIEIETRGDNQTFTPEKERKDALSLPVWIYTQDRPFTGKRIYAPVRNPAYNESNYQTTVSLPAWKDLR